MRDYDKDRETYIHLLADVDDAERALIAAKDAVRRFQFELASEVVEVGDVIVDHKGHMLVTRVRFDYMKPDDARRNFGNPSVDGVRRRADGSWGKRVVNTWSGSWKVVQRKGLGDA